MADLIHNMNTGPCTLCAPQPVFPHKCNLCGTQIHYTETMRGNGYSSPTPHHYHDDHGLKSCIFSELCADCYRKAFAESYPATPCPI